MEEVGCNFATFFAINSKRFVIIARKSDFWAKNAHKGQKYAFSDVLGEFLPFTDQKIEFFSNCNHNFLIAVKNNASDRSNLG